MSSVLTRRNADPNDREEEHRLWIKIVNRSAYVVATVSYVLGFFTFGATGATVVFIKYVVWLLWTVCPAAWFFIEFSKFAPDVTQKDEFERFKYAQELYGKVWLAIVAGLAILYAGENVLKSIAEHVNNAVH